MKPDLDAIRARCEAATPGPWQVCGSTYDEDCREHLAPFSLEDSDERLIWSSGGGEYAHPDMPTAQFIAHARADIPALLAYIDDLEHERDGWKFNACDARDRIPMLEHMVWEEMQNVDTLRERIAELEAARDCLPPVNAEHEAIVDGMLAQTQAQATKRPIRKDVGRRRAEDRCSVRGSPHCWNRDGDITKCANCAATRALPIPEEP